MNRKNNKSPNRDLPKQIRGKYASAFEKGVRVVIHAAERDRSFVVRKNPDGGISWKPEPTTAAKRRRKAS